MNPTRTGNQPNPFLQILSQLQGAQSGKIGGPVGPAMGGMQGTAPTGQPAMMGGRPGGVPMAGGMQTMMPGQPQPQTGGQTGGATKLLVGAIQSLHQFATQALDPQEAALVRQIISLLASILQKEQTRMTQTVQGQQSPGQMGKQIPGQQPGIIGR